MDAHPHQPSADSIVVVARRWAIDWLNSHDPSVCDQVFEPDYLLHIGALELPGRDAYVSGTVGQLKLFPGLGVTVHDLVASADWCAVRFTEHGASTRHAGAVAAWTGIALHRWNGRLLTETYAQEDYLSRQRQLADGRCNAIEAPAPAPWDTAVAEPDPRSEDVVRAWLDGGGLDRAGGDDAIVVDDCPPGRAAPVLTADRIEVEELFSAGPKVAFHVVAHGRSVPDPTGVDDAVDGCSLAVAGLVEVIDGQVSAGHLVRDRLGLRKQAKSLRA